MKKLAVLLLLLLLGASVSEARMFRFGGAPVLSPCGPHTAPAVATAHGFGCEIFWDDFTSLATVDTTNTRAPNFKWYVQGGYGSTTPAASFSIVAGGLQLSSALDNSGTAGAGLYSMGSCAGLGTFGTTTGYPAGFVGKPIVGGMYIDIKLTTWGPQLGGNNGWPAAWTLSTDQLYGLPSALSGGPELDLREWAGTEGRYVHYWQAGGTDTGGGTYVNPTRAFTSGDTYGALLLKPAQNGGTGTIVGYLNDVVETNSTPITWAPGGNYSNMTEKPMCVLFATGFNQPIVIRSVQVWTTPP